MEFIAKRFKNLTVEELHEIYKLRSSVFVVEQNCVYLDIDDYDKIAYHLYLKDNGNIVAYIRVLPQNTLYSQASIGRVISLKRRCGYASTLLEKGKEFAKNTFGYAELIVGAQTYARTLYEKVGFKQVSQEYLEDGIPHIRMICPL